jgi:hypothetical protein
MKFESSGLPLGIALLLLALPCPAPAQAPSESPASASSTVTRNFPAASVEDVVVPVPSEVFNVLDKLGSPNWRGELRDKPGRQTGDRAQVALLLGTVIADGFVAVEAKDSEKIKDLGRDVLTLAGAINVREAVIARSKSIVDKAEKKRWLEARREFDGALQDVRGAMEELNDRDLAQLVSLGGWIRGTEVLTSIVRKEYRPDKAELLHQPELIVYFNKRIDNMAPSLRKNPHVAKIRKTLDQIRPLIGQTNGSDISLENVEKINQMSAELIQSISAHP